MTIDLRLLDWKKYDTRVQALEAQLEALLSLPAYSSDDRRLARVYTGLARLIEDRLDAKLRGYLALAEQYSSTGAFPRELEDVSTSLGAMSRQLAAQEEQSGTATDRPLEGFGAGIDICDLPLRQSARVMSC